MSIMFFYMSELHFLHGCFMFCCISALDFGVKQITFTPLPQARLHFKVTWIDCVLGYNGYHLSPPPPITDYVWGTILTPHFYSTPDSCFPSQNSVKDQ